MDLHKVFDILPRNFYPIQSVTSFLRIFQRQRDYSTIFRLTLANREHVNKYISCTMLILFQLKVKRNRTVKINRR